MSFLKRLAKAVDTVLVVASLPLPHPLPSPPRRTKTVDTVLVLAVMIHYVTDVWPDQLGENQASNSGATICQLVRMLDVVLENTV